ncbi:unnamed protein product [Orchesella dallaii]|uniref:Secreted protein n=1 Tax=Orchesella dallaii TaxID=48710 RepID=A0ABP1RT94_9HEXA
MPVTERKSVMRSFALAMTLIVTFLVSDSNGAAMPDFSTVCAKRITLYTDKLHSGSSIDVYPYRLDSSTPACYDLPTNWQDKASSINTNGNCVIVWSLSGCNRGKNMRIAPGTDSHYNLAGVGMDDDIRAVQLCP